MKEINRQMLRFVFLLPMIIFFTVIFSPQTAFAQGLDDWAMRRGFGGRASGMGGAYTAIAEDGSAVFYNPAGLAAPGFGLTIGNPDTEDKNIKGSFTFAKLGFAGYGTWDFRNARGDDYLVSDFALGSKSGWLNWGASFKNQSWNIGGSGGQGWSSDLGFLARITPKFKVGILAQDLLTSNAAVVPAAGRIGLSFMPFDDWVVLAGDLEIAKSFQTYGHLGIEAAIVKGLTVRGGVDRGEPTAGLSIDLPLISADYAAIFQNNGQTIQRFEAGIRIVPKKERPFSIIKPKEYALVDLNGSIVGGREQISLFGGVTMGLDSILAQLRKCSKDSSIDGIMLRIQGFRGGLGGMAVVQEIRSELEKIKSKGKKVVAYLEGGGLGDEYYLASAADKIVAPPGSAIGGFGKSVEIYRIEGVYKKFGIDWQLFSKGKYKAAFDPLNPKMSKDQKEMVEGLIADLYRQMVTDIAGDRKIPIEKVKKIGEGTIYTSNAAKKMGLVDVIGYYDDAKKVAAEIAGESKNKAEIVEPNLVEPEESFLSQVSGVAVIEVDGEIVLGSGGENLIFGGRYIGSDTIAKYIKQASDNLFIKAIILRINSPGGDSVAAGEIYQALQYAKEKKKVMVASIGNIGASGGYYIASAADKIISDRSSITGSIGVIGYFPVFSGLMGKLDATAEVVKEGKHADMFSGLRKFSSEEIAAIEKLQDEAYREFVSAVAVGRNLATKEVEKIAQGKVYTGSQALDLKLVDKLGGFSDAVDLAKETAQIGGDVRLIFFHEPGLFPSLGEGLSESLDVREAIPWKQLLWKGLAPDPALGLRYN